MTESLVALAKQALTEPRAAGRGLMSLGIPSEAVWPAIFLVVVGSTLLNAVVEMLSPSRLAAIPHFYVAAFFVAVFAGFSFAVWQIGRMMGGEGSLRDSLLLTAFLQGMILVAQVVQLVLIVLSPVIAVLYSIAVFVAGIWINVNFIDALHGFNSLPKSLGVLLLSSLAFGVALFILAAVLGVTAVGTV